MKRNKQEHDKGLEHLLHRPNIIGVTTNPLWSASKIQVYKTFPELETDVDLLYATPSDIWVAEYKTAYGHRKKAMQQLEAASEFVWDNFRTRPHCVYVVGDYHSPEVNYLGKV